MTAPTTPSSGPQLFGATEETAESIRDAVRQLPLRAFVVRGYRNGSAYLTAETKDLYVTAHNIDVSNSGVLGLHEWTINPQGGIENRIRRMFTPGFWTEIEEVLLPAPTGRTN